jgi:hypothetical protein
MTTALDVVLAILCAFGLLIAAIRGYFGLLKLLGILLKKENRLRRKLFRAIRNHDREVLNSVLGFGNIDEMPGCLIHRNGQSVLHIAAASGYEEGVKLLLDADGVWGCKRASANAIFERCMHHKNRAGLTPADAAREKGYTEIAELIRAQLSEHEEWECEFHRRCLESEERERRAEERERVARAERAAYFDSHRQLFEDAFCKLELELSFAGFRMVESWSSTSMPGLVGDCVHRTHSIFRGEREVGQAVIIPREHVAYLTADPDCKEALAAIFDAYEKRAFDAKNKPTQSQ